MKATACVCAPFILLSSRNGYTDLRSLALSWSSSGTDRSITGRGKTLDDVAKFQHAVGMQASQVTPVHGLLLGLRDRPIGCDRSFGDEFAAQGDFEANDNLLSVDVLIQQRVHDAAGRLDNGGVPSAEV